MSQPKPIGRAKPYSLAGIRRCRCRRCGKAASAQWSICANGNRQVPICTACDIALNRMVLTWLGADRVDDRMAIYERRKRRAEGAAA